MSVDLTNAESASPEVIAKLNQHFARLFGTPPRYNYFQRGNGPMFCWTVEKNPSDGRYASFVYKPVGKGARSGKATAWQLVESGRWGIVEHAKRKTAKARALRLYRAYEKKSSD